MTDILGLTKEQIAEYIEAIGEPKYRASSIFTWLHQKQVDCFEEMSDLPKELRKKLKETIYIGSVSIANRQLSADGTEKFLFKLHDGNYVESVAMSYRYGITVCISTQVGCRMGCSFCASSLGGLVRNLTVSEMLLQVYMIGRIRGVRISNIVLMGIGEPFDNLCNVLSFCDIISDDAGYGIGKRAITISTCGLVEGILKLTKENMKYTLSVSLHAPTDLKRSSLMPINNRYNIATLIESCRNYQQKTKRRISFEYAVISGVNNSNEDAKALSLLLQGMNAHVNLIAVNSVRGSGYASNASEVEIFRAKLEKLGINVTARRTLGLDIDAACGQLRRSKVDSCERETLQ